MLIRSQSGNIYNLYEFRHISVEVRFMPDDGARYYSVEARYARQDLDDEPVELWRGDARDDADRRMDEIMHAASHSIDFAPSAL